MKNRDSGGIPIYKEKDDESNYKSVSFYED
jgi:hypothetical protein